MASLYQSGYRPFRLPKKYEATSIAIKGDGQAGDVMRRKGVNPDYGDPIDAVAFFDNDGDGLAALVCDYANGKRVEYCCTQRESRLTFTTPARAAS